MANIFTRALDYLAQQVASYLNDDRAKEYNILADYYAGDHRKQIKTKVGKQDDNIIQNYVGLAVDRSVSRLFRGGVEFNLPDNATAQQEYLDAVWDLNKKEILLYQCGLHGTVYGTSYLQISPDDLLDPFTQKTFPRLTALDPEITRVEVDPRDKERITRYVIEYTVKETTYRTIVRHSREDDYEAVSEAPDTWMVEYWIKVGSAAWQLEEKVEWPYDFPPIIHWKNLPSLKSQYGDSDIDDAINIQDKSNFVVSNTGKIIKFHASPRTIGTGFSAKELEPVNSSPESMFVVPRENAQIFNLEVQSDLASSRNFALDLRQSIFDISREVDISSMADKLGQLTNFGLRVLWGDALDKNDTKRQLYGDALKELNRRLLVLAGYELEKSRPGEIEWGQELPANILEEMKADQLALDMGIIDKQTIAERYRTRYGEDWETIVANLQEQQAADNENNNNIGALILRNFTQGR